MDSNGENIRVESYPKMKPKMNELHEYRGLKTQNTTDPMLLLGGILGGMLFVTNIEKRFQKCPDTNIDGFFCPMSLGGMITKALGRLFTD